MGGRSHKQAGAEFLFSEAKGVNVAFKPLASRTEDNVAFRRRCPRWGRRSPAGVSGRGANALRSDGPATNAHTDYTLWRGHVRDPKEFSLRPDIDARVSVGGIFKLLVPWMLQQEGSLRLSS